MKRKIVVLAIVAAAMLCGCTKTELSEGGSLPETPSSTGLETSDVSSITSETAETSDETRSDVSIDEDTVLPKGETLTIRKGETLYINEGAEYTLEGNIICEEGGGVKLQSGANLLLNGNMELEGEFQLGGYLSVSETGTIGGKGTLEVLNSFDDINCEGTVTAKIKAPAPVEQGGITTVGGIMVVNKKYSLPEDYGDGYLTDDTYNALLEMRADSGYAMAIVSGFRSYETQAAIFQNYCDTDGYEAASTYSAEPGHSEHQSGFALDVTSLDESYGDTEEGMWLAEHCDEYGFIIRYPEGKTDITGYIYEPWHIRYLGKSTAKLVKDSGLTLEEFLGVEG